MPLFNVWHGVGIWSFITKNMEDSIMKRLLLLLAIVFASVQLKASHPESELSLRLFDHSWFTVTIGHDEFTTPVTRFEAGHLAPGSHYIEVTRLVAHPYGYYSHPHVVFSGYIHIPAMSRVFAMIDRHHRLRIQKIVPLFAAPVAYIPAPLHYGMAGHEFANLLRTMDRLSFDSSRLQVARQAIASNYFTSQQVGALLQQLTFESGKLEIAKLAYHKTLDKQNYFVVNDAFTFESSIMELHRYIGV